MTAPVSASVPAVPCPRAARRVRGPAALFVLLSLFSLFAVAAGVAPGPAAALDARAPVQAPLDTGGQGEEAETGQASARPDRARSRAACPARRVVRASRDDRRSAPAARRPAPGVTARPAARAVSCTVLRC
ncbi:hypothetical protein [Streptomyces sp. t39]|uniref:hypothetical protein n=1 Tax=Streptomyces sp. t39 TaxID=1828156 RepID=UPI0011CE2E8D|nr:hypothetical protein [Streptomyces sp. t39]TXS52128.1 hypothetical protein EAO77_21475 [Streptomyces sp. t39]